PGYIGSNSSCRASHTCIRDFFDTKHIALYRLIATDEALARTIRDELALRGVNQQIDQQNLPSKIPLIAKLSAIWATLAEPVRQYLGPAADGNHHVALISEWDTLYGRTLPDTMARCLGQATCEQPDKGDPEWLHRYKYLRGLDGQMPNVAGLDAGDGAK